MKQRKAARINAETTIQADCATFAEKAWLTISSGAMTFSPDITPETAEELRGLADDIDLIYSMFARSSGFHHDLGEPRMAFRCDPDGYLKEPM